MIATLSPDREAAQRRLAALTRDLAHARREDAACAAHLKDLRAEFDRQNAVAIEAAEMAREAVKSLEHQVRELATELYKTGPRETKQMAPGVSIREGTEYTWDEEKALAWCQKTGLALVPASVDARALKKLASVQSLDFVQTATTYSVAIAKDLNAALIEAGVMLSLAPDDAPDQSDDLTQEVA